jgi:hypothetical protein
MALATRPHDMTADALSRRERLVLGVGVTVLSRVARLAERLDRHDRRHGRRPPTPDAVRAQADQAMTTVRRSQAQIRSDRDLPEA